VVTSNDARARPGHGPATRPSVMHVTHDEASQIEQISKAIATGCSSSDDEDLLRRLAVACHELPVRLRTAIAEFRANDDQPALIVRGHRVDQHRVGPTPDDWRRRTSASLPEEIQLLLYASLLGEPFGWRTQQDGHLVHEVFPMRRDEWAQLGTGSRELLTWHSEDAFHPCRAGVATTIGALNRSLLDDPTVDALFERRFIIRPDDSHLARNNSTTTDPASFATISSMHRESEPVAVLTGHRGSPYLRLDPYFMATIDGDEAARRALDALITAIDASLYDCVLQAGDLLILDNMRAVHGRRPFTARYDGTDRWLKRVNVTRDLRRSRGLRKNGSRLVG
jgi:L-asparagine oxygenase